MWYPRKGYARLAPDDTPSRASPEEIAETLERSIDEVGSWTGVTVGEHRFGGTEWRVGPRELGHVWGTLDIAYLRTLRGALIDGGQTGVHHLLDESGWTTFYIEHPDDCDHARWLVRLSFLYHVNVLGKTPAGAEAFEAVDVQRELRDVELDEGVRAAFERRLPGKVGAPG